MMRRLSVDPECKDNYTCQSVWADDSDPDYVVVVGHPAEAHAVPLAEGEVAVRIKRQIVAAAEIR